MIRLAIIDDHPAIVAAFSDAAARTDDVEVVGSAGNLADAVALIDEACPDIVLCDVWLGGEADGLRMIERVGRSPGDRRIIMLSAFEQPSFLRAAFERGAAGYLSKSSEVGEVLNTVRRVAAGETCFPSVTLRALRDAPRPPSHRELDVIGLIAEGATNDEIAARLTISVKTVESHLRRLFGRYAVLSRTELAVLAIREGWVGGRAS